MRCLAIRVRQANPIALTCHDMALIGNEKEKQSNDRSNMKHYCAGCDHFVYHSLDTCWTLHPELRKRAQSDPKMKWKRAHPSDVDDDDDEEEMPSASHSHRTSNPAVSLVRPNVEFISRAVILAFSRSFWLSSTGKLPNQSVTDTSVCDSVPRPHTEQYP